MSSNALISPYGVALLACLMGWAVASFVAIDAVSPQEALVVITVLLLLYLAAEIYRLSRRAAERWMVNPAVLSSLVVFALGFGITNVLYFFPEDVLVATGQGIEVTPAMSKLMLLVLLGAVAMWLGYWSPIGARIAAWLSEQAWIERVIRRSFDPRMSVVAALALISLGSRLLQIQMGVYGYSSDIVRLEETVTVRHYLTMMDGLGELALIVAALWRYAPDAPPRAKVWFAVLLIYEIVFGFLSGFKSLVVMPIVIVGLCKYLKTGTIPWRWLAIVPVAVFVAYAVIEPFRIARYEDTRFLGTSVTNIAETVVVASVTERSEEIDARQIGVAIQFLSRTTMTYIASLGIEFADTRPLPDGSPAFLRDIFLAPLYAVIPRALWEAKESSRHGVWYREEVMRVSGESSVAMSPFTYLYFAGGGLAVVLGFLGIGIAQRAWAERFLLSGAAGSLVVFLAGVRVLAIPDSVFYSMIVDLIRFVPAALVLQYLIYRR